jgi:hypothetical protein
MTRIGRKRPDRSWRRELSSRTHKDNVLCCCRGGFNAQRADPALSVQSVSSVSNRPFLMPAGCCTTHSGTQTQSISRNLSSRRDARCPRGGTTRVGSCSVKSFSRRTLRAVQHVARGVRMWHRMNLPALLAAAITRLSWRARSGRLDMRPAPVSRVDASFADGWEHLQQEEFAEAERAFRFVLDGRPENADASLYLGIALAGQGRHAEAIAPLRDAAAARPLDAEVHARLGMSLGETGELFLAMTSLREALRLRPGLRPVEVALEELVSAAAVSAGRTAPVRARFPRRGARRRSHRYTRRTMPASSRELQVGA